MTEENVRICFLHHSGFAVEFQDCVLLLDVWKDPAGEVRRIAEETRQTSLFFCKPIIMETTLMQAYGIIITVRSLYYA